MIGQPKTFWTLPRYSYVAAHRATDFQICRKHMKGGDGGVVMVVVVVVGVVMIADDGSAQKRRVHLLLD